MALTGKGARQAGKLVGPGYPVLPRRLGCSCAAIAVAATAAAILLPNCKAASATAAAATSQAEAAHGAAADGGGQALYALWCDDQIGEEPTVTSHACRETCSGWQE